MLEWAGGHHDLRTRTTTDVSSRGKYISLKLSLLLHRYKPLTCHLPGFVLLSNGTDQFLPRLNEKGPESAKRACSKRCLHEKRIRSALEEDIVR